MNDEMLLDKIVMNSEVLMGKPVIRGTRLTVDFILNLLAHGSTEEQIIAEYEGLTQDDIKACILFAMKCLANAEFMPLVIESSQV